MKYLNFGGCRFGSAIALIAITMFGCASSAPRSASFVQASQIDFDGGASFTEPNKKTFFVAASGDDSADGKTAKTAWRTIAKVNQTRFEPGAQILFRSGDVWREQVTVGASGAAGAPITFGAYPNASDNSANKKAPLIAGSDLVKDWNSASAKTFRARLEAAPENVYVDDELTPMTKSDSLGQVETVANSWFYDSAQKYLYVQLKTADSPAAHAVEAAVRDHNFYANGKSYIKINGLHLKHAKYAAVLAEQDNADFWTVSNCAIRNASIAGVYARPADRTGAPLLRGWTVENNRIGRIDHRAVLDYDRAGILLRHVENATVKNNTVATVNEMGITIRDYFKAGGSVGGTISGNTLTDNQGNISIWMTSDAVVRENKIFNSKGYGIGVGVTSHRALIAYNTINFLRESADGTLYNGIDVNADSQNGRIFHNTIVNVRGFNLTLEQSDEPCNGWTVANNIFDARDAPYLWHSNIAVDPLVNVYAFSNNLYVPSKQRPAIVNHWHRKDMTMPEWTAATNDQNSIAADPLFADVANNDLALRQNSPARAAARRINGVNDGKPLNIGAY